MRISNTTHDMPDIENNNIMNPSLVDDIELQQQQLQQQCPISVVITSIDNKSILDISDDATAATTATTDDDDGTNTNNRSWFGGNSPGYYYFRFLVSLLALLQIPHLLQLHSPACHAYPHNREGTLFFALLLGLWLLQGLAHLYLIVHRAVVRAPPTQQLYTEGVDKLFKIPLLVDSILVIGVCLWGISILTLEGGRSTPCGGQLNSSIWFVSILFLVLSILGLLSMFRHVLVCRSADNNHKTTEDPGLPRVTNTTVSYQHDH